MIEFFKSIGRDPSKGLNLDDIKRWVRSPYVVGRVSLYAIGADERVFSHTSGGTDVRVVIGIRIMADHMSLLPRELNPSLAGCLGAYVNQSDTWPDAIEDYAQIAVTSDAPQCSDLIDLIVGAHRVPSGHMCQSSQFEPSGEGGHGGVIFWSPDIVFDMDGFTKRLVSSLASRLGCVFPIKWSAGIRAVKIRDDFFLYFSSEDLHGVNRTLLALRENMPFMPSFSVAN